MALTALLPTVVVSAAVLNALVQATVLLLLVVLVVLLLLVLPAAVLMLVAMVPVPVLLQETQRLTYTHWLECWPSYHHPKDGQCRDTAKAALEDVDRAVAVAVVGVGGVGGVVGVGVGAVGGVLLAAGRALQLPLLILQPLTRCRRYHRRCWRHGRGRWKHGQRCLAPTT